jgi:glycerophosphoryl diester phosphodiesterase
MIRLLIVTLLSCCIGSHSILAKPQDAPEVTIIGHRGSGLAPTSGTKLIGNTFNAIQRGIDAGADWIEIDIRQSKDGTLMVFHDATVDRNTDGTGKLDSFTKEQLQALTVKVTPPETIPTLEAVLEQFAPKGTRMVLDIKAHGLRQQLETMIAQHLQHEEVILFGDYSILKEYIDSPYRRGYTALYSEGSNRYRFWIGHSFLVNRAEKLGCDTLVLPPMFLKESLIRKSADRKIAVWSYGSDGTKAWKSAINQGVTGLIVDDVALAKDK